jgi:hypothetical protein
VRRILVALTAAGLAALTLTPAAGAAAAPKPGCDPLDRAACLLPWPSNAYTVPNVRTDTGRQVKLRPALMPKSAKGVSAFSSDLNNADGFSPGTPIMTMVRGLDLKRTGAVPITDLRAARDRSQPVVVIDTVTRTRQLVWAEIDGSASRGQDRLLVIRAARNFQTGRRYIVALRNLKTASGATIPAPAAFRALRDGKKAGPAVEARRAGFKQIFRILGKAGIDRRSLYLAWDFTVASDRNLTERSVAIRDNVFTNLGDKNLVDRKVVGRAPAYSVDRVQELAACGADGCQAGESDQLARVVTGTLRAPCFLDADGCPAGSKFRFKRTFEKSRFGNNRFTFVPVRRKGNTMSVPFRCTIPRSALTRPGRPVSVMPDLYGSPDDLLGPNLQALAAEGNLVLCATALPGWSAGDEGRLPELFGDLRRVPAFVDRTQQGYLNQLLLQRLLLHPDGFPGQGAFKGGGGRGVIDTFGAYALGLGTGGVIGGGAVAIAPDVQRAALVGAGMNLSLMLPRSTDSDRILPAFRASYPKALDRALLLAAYQSVWDRGETNGYASQLGQVPPPATPLHSVLVQTAYGDQRVPPLSAEVQMRTIEGVVREPAYDNGRFVEKIPMFEVIPAGKLELGSALSVWDSGPVRAGGALGAPFAPLGPQVPRGGVDPHGLLMADPKVRRQQTDFLQPDGKLVDACPEDRGCRLAPYPY